MGPEPMNPQGVPGIPVNDFPSSPPALPGQPLPIQPQSYPNYPPQAYPQQPLPSLPPEGFVQSRPVMPQGVSYGQSQISMGQRSRRKSVIIAVIAVVVLALIVAVVFFYFKGDNGKPIINSTGKTYTKAQIERIFEQRSKSKSKSVVSSPKKYKESNLSNTGEFTIDEGIEFSDSSDKTKAEKALAAVMPAAFIRAQGIERLFSIESDSRIPYFDAMVVVNLIKPSVNMLSAADESNPLNFLYQHRNEFKGSIKVDGRELSKDMLEKRKVLARYKTKSGYQYEEFEYEPSYLIFLTFDRWRLFALQIDNIYFECFVPYAADEHDVVKVRKKFEDYVEDFLEELKE